MRCTFVTTVLVLVLGLTAFADATIKQTTSGKGMGMSGTMPGTVRIKGNKMRSDTTMGDKIQTTIFDLDAQKMYIFDSKKKEADVWDMASFAAELSKTVDTSAICLYISAIAFACPGWPLAARGSVKIHPFSTAAL